MAVKVYYPDMLFTHTLEVHIGQAVVALNSGCMQHLSPFYKMIRKVSHVGVGFNNTVSLVCLQEHTLKGYNRLGTGSVQEEEESFIFSHDQKAH